MFLLWLIFHVFSFSNQSEAIDGGDTSELDDIPQSSETCGLPLSSSFDTGVNQMHMSGWQKQSGGRVMPPASPTVSDICRQTMSPSSPADVEGVRLV